jgi:HTH-type transcriptional regulator / antitoxin HipB
MKPTEQPPHAIHDAADLGRWILHARRAQHLSGPEAAELCGVTKRFVSEVERGKPTAQVGKVLQLLTGLGLVMTLSRRGERP